MLEMRLEWFAGTGRVEFWEKQLVEKSKARR
jgi:hypothetical protein